MTTKTNEVWQYIISTITKIESDLKKLKALAKKIWTWYIEISQSDIDELTASASHMHMDDSQWIKIIEWIFDGTFMIWADGNKYPVPTNYSSKSKLVYGDNLKCTIMSDGTLKYKIISQLEHRYLKATLIKSQTWQMVAIADDHKQYRLNQAAVTYFGWDVWDEVTIILPSSWDADFAAIELVIKH